MAEIQDGDSKSKDLSGPRIRRRNRMITSCLECRRRKLKCDKLHPCTNCSKFSRDCMFLAPALDSVSQKKLNELKEKMGSLERVLEDDIARNPGSRTGLAKERKRAVADLPGEDSNSDPEAPEPEDEKTLEATPMVGFDAAYEDGGDEDVLDVGIRIGLLRLNERIGGMFRPRLSEELAIQLGAPIRRDLNDPEIPKLPDHDDFITPGPEYIAPGPGFVFGDVGPRRNLIDYLPSKAAADALIASYYNRCHFVARVVHWPSFQMQYDTFWSNILQGIEPPTSLQALVMSCFFSGTASMTEEEIMNLFGNPRTNILTSFQTGTEVALGKSNFLRTTKIETLQALIIYLIPMCKDEQSRAHSVLVGLAIRLAECIALHRDPAEHFGISATEAHVRRILWFQVCWLDYHTADKQGPRPFIRRDDYDTRFPLNVDDTTLMIENVKEDKTGWTDMTVSRIRFECCEMWRIARADIERLHNKKISITHALGKIESFRRAMEAKYLPVLDLKIPIQRLAKYIMDMSIHRMHVATLHRYHHAVQVSIPDRLRQIIITSGVISCEAAMQLWLDPDLRDWYWYRTALFGWPTAALLALDIFTFPNRREADRIWSVLDFVFKTEPTLPRDIKARMILSAIRDRTAFYRSLRGFRVPVNMQNRLDTSLAIRRAPTKGHEMLIPASGNSDKEKSPPAELPGIPQVRRESLKKGQLEPSVHLSSPLKTEDNSNNTSWTMENPFTMFAAPPSITQERSNPRSDITSISPSGRHASLPPPTAPASVPTVRKGSLSRGVATGHSPSNSSSATENWPPTINSDQHGWRYAFQSPSPQQNQMANAHQQQQQQQPQPHHAYQHNQHQQPHHQNISPPPQMNPQMHDDAQFHNHAHTQGQMQAQLQNPAHAQGQNIPQPYSFTYNNSNMQSMPAYFSSNAGPPNHIPFVPTPVGVSSSTLRQVPPMPTSTPVSMTGMGNTNVPARPTNQAQPGQPPTLDINWAEWDKIFPPELNNGNLDQPDYRPPR